MAPEPDVLEQEATDAQTRLATPWNVIVHNDPVTLMVYVTMIFQRLFGYAYARAHQLMMEVHTQGRAVVWTGAREQAETYVQKLHAAQLLATLELVGE
ncbi:MAG: ATP-dependent Clp protease adapter ClpS [Planctomycetota bacterium]